MVRDQESVYGGDGGGVHGVKDDGRASGLNCWMDNGTITKKRNI